MPYANQRNICARMRCLGNINANSPDSNMSGVTLMLSDFPLSVILTIHTFTGAMRSNGVRTLKKYQGVTQLRCSLSLFRADPAASPNFIAFLFSTSASKVILKRHE